MCGRSTGFKDQKSWLEELPVQSSAIREQVVTILVVDDDALITLNTSDQLSELGYVPLEAFSAAEALAMLGKEPEIAAMITDYSMPGMNGVELAKAARAIRPDLPILLATGYADLPEDAPSDLPRLEKPFREDELASQIELILKLESAG
jgi:CheY-like chemotaxis protein